MVTVNLWLDEGCDFQEGEFELYYISSDEEPLSLIDEPRLIVEAIISYTNAVETDIMYRVYLQRTEFRPRPDKFEAAFRVVEIVEERSHCRSTAFLENKAQ